MPSPQPSPTGEGENIKNGNLVVTVLRLPLPLYVDLRLIIQIYPPWVILNQVMLPVSFSWALSILITAD